jgi:hypothetical protein
VLVGNTKNTTLVVSCRRICEKFKVYTLRRIAYTRRVLVQKFRSRSIGFKLGISLLNALLHIVLFYFYCFHCLHLARNCIAPLPVRKVLRVSSSFCSALSAFATLSLNMAVVTPNPIHSHSLHYAEPTSPAVGSTGVSARCQSVHKSLNYSPA